MSDWCDGKLSDLISHHTGGGTPARNVDAYWNGDIPWASVKDFCAGQKKLTSTQEAITIRGLQASASNLIPANTVLICSRMAVGRVAITAQPTAINQDVKALFATEGVSADYLYYLLTHCENHFASIAVGSTVKGISTGQILDKTVSFPSSGGARDKIAEILDTLDTAIRAAEAIIAKLQAVKQGLLHDLLTRGLDTSGQLRPPPALAPELYQDSPLGLIPREWKVKSIEKCDIQLVDGDRGKNYPSESEFSAEGFCLFLSAKNVTNAGFRFEDRQFISSEKDSTLGTGKLQRGDIVVTTRGTFGNFAFFSDFVPFNDIRINSGMLILRNCSALLETSFLYMSLKDYLFPIELLKKGSGSAQPQLPAKDLKTFSLLIPSVREQKQLVAAMASFESRLEAEEFLLQKQLHQKSGLMDDLLTGRVRVKVAETEMA